MLGKDDYENDNDDDDEESNDFFDIFRGLGDPYDPFGNIDPIRLFNLKEFLKMFMRDKAKSGFKGPIIYGFNIGVGPNGKPVMSSFGNIEKEFLTGETKVRKTREPMVEVNEEGDQIVLVAEMPGVSKEDIEITTTNRVLTISTEKNVLGRRYFKEIELPGDIDSDYVKARYTNGILEIRLKKLMKKEKGTSIEVE